MTTRATAGERAGRRAQRVVADVLDATLAELARVGYGALRIDEVAARAKVNKTTVYRRWPNRIALVSEAVRDLAAKKVVPDTGSLRGDLLAMVRSTIELGRSEHGAAVVRLLCSEWQHPEVEALAGAIRAEHHGARAAIVQRAIARGEIRADLEATLILEAVHGVVYNRLRYQQSIDERLPEQVVDLVLEGARPVLS